MALLETWRNLAYDDGLDDKKREELWSGYFAIEKGIYEQILEHPEEVITGTVKGLAEKYNTEILIMTGFLDGINESLKGYENPIETMEEDTEVKIEIDPEKLYHPLPKFPASTRDIAVLVDDAVPAASMQAAVEKAAGKLLESVKLFDVYKGKGIPEGKKSVAYSLSLRAPDRTLTDEECDKAMRAAISALETEFGAQLRG